MNLSVDTNVLVRAVVRDDVRQAKTASKILQGADVIAISSLVFAELVWVLRKGYGLKSADIAKALRLLAAAKNVALDRPAFEAGLAMLEAGGDFADGVIAHDGKWLGGATFVSFDKEAVALLKSQGQAVKVL